MGGAALAAFSCTEIKPEIMVVLSSLSISACESASGWCQLPVSVTDAASGKSSTRTGWPFDEDRLAELLHYCEQQAPVSIQLSGALLAGWRVLIAGVCRCNC